MAKEVKPLVKFLKIVPDFDDEGIEEQILKIFRDAIYLPLVIELNMEPKTILNAHLDALNFAIQSNKIYYKDGVFSGDFKGNPELIKQLRSLGAKWNPKGTYSLDLEKLLLVPKHAEAAILLKSSVSISEAGFTDMLSRIDRQLAALVPKEIAEHFKLTDAFDKSLFKMGDTFDDSVKAVDISPVLSKQRVDEIRTEYETNVQLSIKGFSEKQIDSLRQKVKESFYAGNRYGSLVKILETEYGVTSKKRAKFIARQETNLLSAKYRETRYRESGIEYYIWTAVHGTAKHPTRKRHRELDGTMQRFDMPPVISADGQPVRHGHPGEDFNCRCIMRPVLFKVQDGFEIDDGGKEHAPNKSKF